MQDSLNILSVDDVYELEDKSTNLIGKINFFKLQPIRSETNP